MQIAITEIEDRILRKIDANSGPTTINLLSKSLPYTYYMVQVTIRGLAMKNFIKATFTDGEPAHITEEPQYVDPLDRRKVRKYELAARGHSYVYSTKPKGKIAHEFGPLTAFVKKFMSITYQRGTGYE